MSTEHRKKFEATLQLVKKLPNWLKIVKNGDGYVCTRKVNLELEAIDRDFKFKNVNDCPYWINPIPFSVNYDQLRFDYEIKG